MKLSHLDAMAKSVGFSCLKDYLYTRYVTERKPMDELAYELDVSISTISQTIKAHRITKPKHIPLKLEDAKRMDLATISKVHGISRATAWRWKNSILRTETSGAKHEDSTGPDAAEPSTGDEDAPHLRDD